MPRGRQGAWRRCAAEAIGELNATEPSAGLSWVGQTELGQFLTSMYLTTLRDDGETIAMRLPTRTYR